MRPRTTCCTCRVPFWPLFSPTSEETITCAAVKPAIPPRPGWVCCGRGRNDTLRPRPCRRFVAVENRHESALLEFLVLNAARSGEVRLMVWDEVDLFARLWTVPASGANRGAVERIGNVDPGRRVRLPVGFPRDAGRLCGTSGAEPGETRGDAVGTIRGRRASYGGPVVGPNEGLSRFVAIKPL